MLIQFLPLLRGWEDDFVKKEGTDRGGGIRRDTGDKVPLLDRLYDSQDG